MHVAGIVAGNAGRRNASGGGRSPPMHSLPLCACSKRFQGACPISHLCPRAGRLHQAGRFQRQYESGPAPGTAGMEDPLFLKALQAARKAGIQVVIAGGNDGRFGYGSSRPSVEFPDYGLISTPGVSPDGLTVASLENTYTVMGAISVEDGSDDMLHGELYKNNLITDEAPSTIPGVRRWTAAMARWTISRRSSLPERPLWCAGEKFI